MSDVVGRGVIELVADARKLKAGIEDAKRSIRTLGEGQKDISTGAQQSIDRYIGKLQQQNLTVNKSAREVELFRLALRGASNEQLKSADAALRIAENQKRVAESAQSIGKAFVAFGAIAVTSLLATAVAFDRLVKHAGDFQDMAEKVGDTASNFSSLAVAAAVGGASMESVVGASTKLSKALTGVDDDSKAAGAAVEALGLDLKAFKQLSATEQIEAVAKAMANFEDGTAKTAAAMALFGKAGAELLPFLKELAGQSGRVNILTSEQIRLADEYSDSQKRLAAQISLHAQAIATDLLPAVNDFSAALRDIIKDQEFAATAGSLLEAALGGALIVFQATAVFVSDLAFTFKAVGREIGAVAAQLAALARLDFSGFTAISDAVKEDAERSRKELDRFQARILSIGTATLSKADASQNSRELNRSGVAAPIAKGKLNFIGAAKKASGADTAAQEAKAQLAFDLEQIRKSSEAIIDAVSNQEKILQALHSASLTGDKKFFQEKLTDEAQYFAEKRSLLLANSAEQERALQEEIGRLDREKFTGKNASKDRVDNDRKIAEAQAKIAKVRADSSADLAVLQIQEFSSAQKLAEENNKLVQSYDDAKIAADDYIKSVIRRNQADLAGIGKGNQFREIQAGRNQIGDKLIAEDASLNRDLRNQLITPDQFKKYLALAQDTFSKELIAYDDHIEAILKSQADWVNGAKAAFQNYIDDAANVAKQTEDLLTHAFKNAEDALVEFATTGKISFKSLIDSMVADIARMQAKQIVAAGANAIGGGDWFSSIAKLIGGGLFGGGGASWTSGFDLPMGSFADGTDFVPQTGLYQLHQGERVVPAAENKAWGGGITIIQNFPPGTDTRTVNQAAARTGQAAQRAMARLT